MERYIKKLIAEGEHQTLDFKYEISDAKKIARSLAAFANTNGGRLLIGVKDNGNITGVSSDEETYMVETAAHLYCQPEVLFTTKNHNVDGKIVVEIIVEPSKTKPHFAPDKDNIFTAFMRVKDENQVANNVILKVWELESQTGGVFLTYTETERVLLSYIEKYGEINFTKARRITKANQNKVENMLANFITIGLIEPVFNNQKMVYQIRTSGNFTF